MSVFTKVSHAELLAFLPQYPLHDLIGFQGIGEGVENTNYFVDTADGRWVLTLFERLNHADLPFFLGLMEHLSARGIPCPSPLRTKDNRALVTLNGKPAAMVKRLTGQSVLFPTVGQCSAVGRLLAELHAAGLDYRDRCSNSRGAKWRRGTAEKLLKTAEADTAALIRDELAAQAQWNGSDLPQGVIHADLFKDNVLFVDERLSGVIDFYYACNDALLYDLAVTLNDWCFDVHGHYDAARGDALLAAYVVRRAPTTAERTAWPLVLRAAAFRFFLSRLYDWTFPREGDVVHIKDPAEYRRILAYHRAHSVPLPNLA